MVVDTTVQEKNITHPVDSKLHVRIIEHCRRLAAVESLLPSIHEVDRNATAIWFRFYPLSLHRFLAGAALRAQEYAQAEGLIKDDLIECPKHNGRFEIRDGSVLRPPPRRPGKIG